MKFDSKSIKLPFYPGDSLFWIDQDEMEVKEQKRGIDAVVIYQDEIMIWEGDCAEPEEPESSTFTFLTREKAEQSLEEMKSKLPERNCVGLKDNHTKWYSPEKKLPVSGESVLVTEKSTGRVMECQFQECWEGNADVFISYHRKPRIVKILCWSAMPEPGDASFDNFQ